MYKKVIYTLVNPINQQNISKRALPKLSDIYIIRLRYESFEIEVFSTASVHLFLAESGIPAEYTFDQLMGFSDLMQAGRFA